MFVCANVSFFMLYLLMLSVSRLYTIDGRMTAELERISKEVTVAEIRQYPDICLSGLMETMKNFSQDSQSDLAEIQMRQQLNRSPYQPAWCMAVTVLFCL
jgi:hypothetical protein